MTVDEMKIMLPYGKIFTVKNEDILVGVYTANDEFRVKDNGDIVMVTTGIFDTWSSQVTVFKDGKLTFR